MDDYSDVIDQYPDDTEIDMDTIEPELEDVELPDDIEVEEDLYVVQQVAKKRRVDKKSSKKSKSIKVVNNVAVLEYKLDKNIWVEIPKGNIIGQFSERNQKLVSGYFDVTAMLFGVGEMLVHFKILNVPDPNTTKSIHHVCSGDYLSIPFVYSGTRVKDSSMIKDGKDDTKYLLYQYNSPLAMPNDGSIHYIDSLVYQALVEPCSTQRGHDIDKLLNREQLAYDDDFIKWLILTVCTNTFRWAMKVNAREWAQTKVDVIVPIKKPDQFPKCLHNYIVAANIRLHKLNARDDSEARIVTIKTSDEKEINIHSMFLMGCGEFFQTMIKSASNWKESSGGKITIKVEECALEFLFYIIFALGGDVMNKLYTKIRNIEIVSNSIEKMMQLIYVTTSVRMAIKYRCRGAFKRVFQELVDIVEFIISRYGTTEYFKKDGMSGFETVFLKSIETLSNVLISPDVDSLYPKAKSIYLETLVHMIYNGSSTFTVNQITRIGVLLTDDVVTVVMGEWEESRLLVKSNMVDQQRIVSLLAIYKQILFVLLTNNTQWDMVHLLECANELRKDITKYISERSFSKSELNSVLEIAKMLGIFRSCVMYLLRIKIEKQNTHKIKEDLMKAILKFFEGYGMAI